MSDALELKNFLEDIMKINVVSMGGAGAGIVGISDANNDTINSLKRSAIAFAEEYRKRVRNQTLLEERAEETSSYIQTLNLTNTLSDRSAEALIDELGILMDRTSV